MTYEEEYIQNKLKGSLAEQLFELLHLELGCQVYRTGQEFLYPHLFVLANTKKKIIHKFSREVDYQDLLDFGGKFIESVKPAEVDTEEWENMMKNKLKQEVGKTRFEKTITGSNLASSPDFTIVSPSGCIEQFEVKFRRDGQLTDEEKNKYLGRNINLFIIMLKEPYIKILKPKVDTIFDKLKLMGKTKDEAFDWILDNLDGKTKEERFKLMKTLLGVKSKEREYYKELKREDDNSLIFRSSSLKSEQIIYPRKLLKKYEEIIKKWFQEQPSNNLN
ncbi:hypothetical protein KAT24_01690 [Candidatus Pacearchaeota archaeon]|nr:hypothetical protein [Candidatus Pacearchaeota archaeon]